MGKDIINKIRGQITHWGSNSHANEFLLSL